MAERGGAAMDVDLLVRDAEVAHGEHGDAGERLVDFEQVDVIDAPAGLLQRLLDRAGGRDGELGRLPGMGGAGDDPRHRLQSLGVGIGLRRENIDELLAKRPKEIQCLEIAPENYLHTGGKLYRKFRELKEIYPIVAHGLSLSLGSLAPLKKDFLKDLKAFLREHNFPWMSDHLCYSSVLGHEFHDLLPLPFTAEAVAHVVPRIRQIQDYLEMPFAIENVSYYAAPVNPSAAPEMPEWEFLAEVAARADCSLLLDVNNIYVNSVNHGFDPIQYIRSIPLERVLHMHLAGHVEYQGFLLDNHGAAIIDPVWRLLEEAAKGVKPAAVIIERDHRMPPLEDLVEEVKAAHDILQAKAKRPAAAGGAATVSVPSAEHAFGYQL